MAWNMATLKLPDGSDVTVAVEGGLLRMRGTDIEPVEVLLVDNPEALHVAEVHYDGTRMGATDPRRKMPSLRGWRERQIERRGG